MSESTAIMSRASAATLERVPLGHNGTRFADMTLEQARQSAADIALLLDIYRRAWREGARRIDLCSAGMARPGPKPAAPVHIDPATQAACKPTTTAGEAGIAGENR